MQDLSGLLGRRSGKPGSDLWSLAFGGTAGHDLGSGSELDRGQRFALFSAVRERLARAAEPDGLLLVLDDIQWADEPSLLLLAHLVRQLRGVRMLQAASAEQAQTVHAETGGNPFLVREPSRSSPLPQCRPAKGAAACPDDPEGSLLPAANRTRPRRGTHMGTGLTGARSSYRGDASRGRPRRAPCCRVGRSLRLRRWWRPARGFRP